MTDCLDAPKANADELDGETYSSLRDAWTAYKTAIATDDTENAREAACIINGIRAGNGMEPIEFERLDGFECDPSNLEQPDRRLELLPKGSSCKEYKDVPARSDYWREDTDAVTRCERFKGDRSEGGGGSDDSPDDGDGVKRCEDERYAADDIREKGHDEIGPWELVDATADITRWRYTGDGATANVSVERELDDGYRYCFVAKVHGWGDETLYHGRLAGKGMGVWSNLDGDSEGIHFSHELHVRGMINWLMDNQDPPEPEPTGRDDVAGWENVSSDPPTWKATIDHPLRGELEGEVQLVSEERRGDTVWGYSRTIPGIKSGTSLSSRDRHEAVKAAERWLQDNPPSSFEADVPEDVEGWARDRKEADEVAWRSYQKPTNTAEWTQQEVRIFTSDEGSTWNIRATWLDTEGNAPTGGSITIRELPKKSSMTGTRSGRKSSFSRLGKAVGYAKEYMENNPEQLIEYDDMPRFEVEATGGYFRSILEPFKRFSKADPAAPTATMDVDSEGAIDIRGVDGSNAVMMDNSLMLAQAESATINRAGDRFGIDVEPVAQAVDDANMTEKASIRTEYNDGQNVPPELVVSIDGTDAERVYMSPDLSRDPDIPDLETGATFGEVSAADWKTCVRGMKKVHDGDGANAVVVSDDEAYLVAENTDADEGEIPRGRCSLTDDDVVLDVDADRFAGFYSADFMRKMAQSPFRPSSTSVTCRLTAPEGFDSAGPMWFEYEQRGGFVKYLISPRIRGDDEPEWDLSTAAPEVSCCPFEGQDMVLAEPIGQGEEPPEVDGIDYDGDTVVWFFPNTDGCRCGTQAQQFDTLAQETGTDVYGIANSPPEDLHGMAESYDLGITLISDEDGRLADDLGVEVENGGFERKAFFVRDGRITEVSGGVAADALATPPAGCPSPTAALSRPEGRDLLDGPEPTVMLEQKDESTLFEVVKHPGVYVITGKRGSGKSSLAMRIAEGMADKKDVKPVTVGMPEGARSSFPGSWLHVDEIHDAPPNSVVVVDEAYAKFHARDAMSDENKSVGQMVNTSRHCAQTYLFVSQNASHLDVNAASEADGLLMKEPGTFHMEFERPQFRDLSEKAKESFEQLPADLANEKYVYAYTDDYQGMIRNSEADFYDDAVSKSFGQSCGTGRATDE